MKYVALIVLLMAAIGFCYLAESTATNAYSEGAYAQVQQQLKELASSEGASGAVKEVAETMKKGRRSAEVTTTFRHGFSRASLLAEVGALVIAVWITVTKQRPNQRPEANAGKESVSPTTPGPGVAHP